MIAIHIVNQLLEQDIPDDEYDPKDIVKNHEPPQSAASILTRLGFSEYTLGSMIYWQKHLDGNKSIAVISEHKEWGPDKFSICHYKKDTRSISGWLPTSSYRTTLAHLENSVLASIARIADE